MKLIAAIEDRGGMLFNHRRCSRDRVLNQWITNLVGEKTLWVHPYSLDLFPDARTDENFLDKAGEDDFCFVEDCSVKVFADRVSELYLCHWNRRYPADFFFDLPMGPMLLKKEEEFVGSSHDKITVEQWKRENL